MLSSLSKAFQVLSPDHPGRAYASGIVRLMDLEGIGG
jgi:hypothetical protein